MIQRMKRAAIRAALVQPFAGRLSVSLPRRVGSHVIQIPVINGLELHADGTGWMSRVLATVLPLQEGAFIDVGANLGQNLLDLLACDGERQYIGWEPNPACVYYLNTLIALNSLHWCTVVPAALADRSGVARLYLHKGQAHDSAATIIEGFRPRHTNLASTIISVATFDDAWSVVGGERVGFVKIDVEGAELQVLRGMSGVLASDRPPVLCEILRAPRDSSLDVAAEKTRALETLMAEQRYSMLRLVKPAGELLDVQLIDHLPVEYWTDATREDRDYLLVPREREAEYLAAAMKARQHNRNGR